MPQPTLLCYNLPEPKAAQIRMLAMRLKVRIRTVAPQEHALPVLALLSGGRPESVPQAEPFREEMLVLAGFHDSALNLFLQTYRKMGIAPVALKAMLTPTNAAWTSRQLHDELLREHAAMHAGQGVAHSG